MVHAKGLVMTLPGITMTKARKGGEDHAWPTNHYGRIRADANGSTESVRGTANNCARFRRGYPVVVLFAWAMAERIATQRIPDAQLDRSSRFESWSICRDVGQMLRVPAEVEKGNKDRLLPMRQSSLSCCSLCPRRSGSAACSSCSLHPAFR